MEHFLKLIYFYSDRPSDLPVLALAHIIYLIETSNKCLFFDKKSEFYEIPK